MFWDTPLNSILVDRTFAFIGEMCWVTQTALALVYVSYDVLGKRTTWIELTGVAAVLVYLVAEFTSYYNTATTNEFYAALEVILDGASYLLMWPASMYLFCKCPVESSGPPKGVSFCDDPVVSHLSSLQRFRRRSDVHGTIS